MRALLLVAAALLLSAPLGSAAVQDLAWSLDARSVTLVVGGPGFTYSSARDSAHGLDALSGSFDAAAARLDARFSAQQPDELEAVLSVAWTALVEYRDADGDGRLGVADPVVQSIAIPGLPATVSASPLLAGGRSATVAYRLPDNGTGGPLPVPRAGGELRLSFTLVQQPFAMPGADLLPTDLGLGAEVRGFPFQAGDTRLALLSDVASPLPVTHGDGQLAAALRDVTLRLAWDETAMADGQPAAAGVATTLDGAGRATVVQSWPRGDEVAHGSDLATQRWTPDAGAVLEALPPGDWRFYALGVAAVAVGLGVPSLRRLRET